MVETTPFKSPPTAPVDVLVGARKAAPVVLGRNSVPAKMGKPVSED